MINTQESSWIALYKQLQLKDEARRQELLPFLPEIRKREYLSKGIMQHEVGDFSLDDLMNRIDPSWYENYLEGFALHERATLQNPPLFRPFFQMHLLKESLGKLPLPPSYLPQEDPLNTLLQASGKQLQELASLLGLYDLVWEVKKVISASQFQQIEATLTERELAFLINIRGDRTNSPLLEMGLNEWNGNQEELRAVLLNRGLFRLAKALSFSSADLIWYLMHALPKELAEEIEAYSERIENLRLHTILMNQTLHSWKFLCTASP